MKVSVIPYNDFVVPFIIGVILLLVISVYKYIKWIRQFDETQRSVIRKNWYSWKIFPAIWEMIREGLFHSNIIKKNLLLGIMHQAFALGWFVLIIVGDMESHSAIKSLQQEQSIERVESVVNQKNWYTVGKEVPNMSQRKKFQDEEGNYIHINYKRPFYLSIFYRYFIHETPSSFKSARLYSDIMDALLLYIFLGLTLAAFKQLYSRIIGMRRTTKHTLIDRFTKFALWSIFPLRLIAESVTASLYNNGGFLTQAIGNLYDPMIVRGLETSIWTFYSVMLAVFFISMPFTRYMHIFTELLLIYFRKIGVKENEKKSGYTMFELNACSRCGVCIDGCPLDKELGNNEVQSVYLVRSIRNQERERVRKRIGDDCLMCDRCVVDCPVGLDLAAIRRIARNKGALDTIGNYNYLNLIKKPFNAIGRIAYFGGCMSHLTPGITESMEKIFEAAGHKYWYMDKERSICCGRPLSQQGFFKQATDLITKNTDILIKSGATMLVTSCPICYRSFKQEYNLPIQVMHHTEYIEMLLKEGILKVRKDDRRVSYHDPCELGRGCKIYEQPRNILRKVTTLQKNRYQKEKSICCGFNLGNTVISIQEQTSIRNSALDNMTYRKVDAIITACPMCKKAFLHATNSYPVQDIAEVVVENLIN